MLAARRPIDDLEETEHNARLATTCFVLSGDAMRMIVFGATGATGRELLAAALAENHYVRAFTRRPDSLSDLAGRIDVAEGDVLEPSSVQRALDGIEVVFSTLTTGGNLGETTLLSEGTKNILAGMEAVKLRRFLVVTSSLVALTGEEPWYVRHVVRMILRHVVEDQQRVEAVVKASSLDWTILRPPRLIDDDARGTYRIAREARIQGGTELAHADLVRFMLKEALERQHLHTCVHLAY
jgi:uncharacterized protein YbjT (DUF2867 family)